MKQVALAAVTLTTVFTSMHAAALPFILDEWRDRYPNLASDQAECQLCHQNVGGSAPWNSYGWELNERITNPFDRAQLDLAFRLLESSDEDGNGISNLDEINDGFQPGWAEGDVNPVFSSSTPSDTIEPPSEIASNSIDHPAELSNPLPDIQAGVISLSLFEVSDGFESPVKAVVAPGINGSIFIVEQVGRISRINLSSLDRNVFLDAQTRTLFGGERGMLGLAFHPQFETNGLFYTYQSERSSDHPQTDFPLTGVAADHVSALVEYRANLNDLLCNATPQRLRTLITIEQPRANHNAGDIAFGPDGMLYISLGDGGGASDEGPGTDPIGNGRDNTTILGSVLRIDVNGNNSNNGEYGIPADNPFIAANDPGLDEIFAYGFRNPYRFSFDTNTGDLYLGDVGQQDIEEINLVTSGGNYGWNWKEGSFFFYDTNSPNNRYVSTIAPPGVPNDLIDPIAEYDHDDGVSAIGGNVYRGSQVPALANKYVFGEFLSRLFYLDENNSIFEFSNLTGLSSVFGFGEDVDRELYILSGTGELLKLQTPGAAYSPPDPGNEISQCPPSEDEAMCFPIVAANGNVASICL